MYYKPRNKLPASGNRIMVENDQNVKKVKKVYHYIEELMNKWKEI